MAAATYKDIQRITGISLSTISKYFNGGNVTDKNRRAIEEAAGQLNFRVNEYARGLKSKKTRTIGVLIYDISNPFSSKIMSDVCCLLRENGYGTIVCDYCNSNSTESEVLEFLLDRMVDGVIMVPSSHIDAHIELAKERGVPVVLLDSPVLYCKTDVVMLDHRSAAMLAAEELVRLGHSDVGIITAPKSVYTLSQREDGFLHALSLRGVVPRDECIARIGVNKADGYEAAKRLLSLERRPTAIFCVNYDLTYGTVLAFHELGVKICDEVSLIGFDDLELLRIVSPRLTIIAQPINEIAKCAVRLIMERLNNASQRFYATMELPATLLRGDSVRDLNIP